MILAWPLVMSLLSWLRPERKPRSHALVENPEKKKPLVDREATRGRNTATQCLSDISVTTGASRRCQENPGQFRENDASPAGRHLAAFPIICLHTGLATPRFFEQVDLPCMVGVVLHMAVEVVIRRTALCH